MPTWYETEIQPIVGTSLLIEVELTDSSENTEHNILSSEQDYKYNSDDIND